MIRKLGRSADSLPAGPPACCRHHAMKRGPGVSSAPSMVISLTGGIVSGLYEHRATGPSAARPSSSGTAAGVDTGKPFLVQCAARAYGRAAPRREQRGLPPGAHPHPGRRLAWRIARMLEYVASIW